MDEILATEADFIAQQQELFREQLAAAWQLHVERVEEQLRAGWRAQLGSIVDERFGEFGGRFGAAVQEVVQRRSTEQDEFVASDARLKWSAELNQITRRLDQAEDMAAWTAALLDGAVAVAPRAFLFSVLSGELVYEGSRAPEGETFPDLDGLRLPLDSAPGFRSVVESLDTVISLGNEGEISATLAIAMVLDDSSRLALLPIATERAGKSRRVAAILAVPGHPAPVDIPALELLACIAGLSLDVRQTAQKAATTVPSGQLLGIAPASEAPPPPVHVVVDVARLTQDEQELHARAQRFARVRVAEMRLYRAQAVKEGRENGNLFLALQPEIESGREQYRHDFFSTPTMIDYFHAELVRTLANDDASMLGPDYPGPLA
jgi:hypothetical protein